jgi:hypothetical protein
MWPTTNPCDPPENLPSVSRAHSCNEDGTITTYGSTVAIKQQPGYLKIAR